MNITMQDIAEFLDIFISADLGISTFYHYTTIDALLNGIIRENTEIGKEVCLRATHIRFVNDQEEISRGAELISKSKELSNPTKSLEEYLSETMKLYENQFLISFTGEDDSLPMWNTYSNKSTGIAVGFDRIKSLSINDLVLKCWYDIQELAKEMKYYKDSDKYELVALLLMRYMPQMLKNKAYEYEKEIRLIGNFKDSPLKFREKKGYIIPYKEVYFSKEQIKTIKLGPCLNQENAEFSLRQFLDSRGFEHVKIEKSKIPYRNL
mgnify:CR=1 FL=1